MVLGDFANSFMILAVCVGNFNTSSKGVFDGGFVYASKS